MWWQCVWQRGPPKGYSRPEMDVRVRVRTLLDGMDRPEKRKVGGSTPPLPTTAHLGFCDFDLGNRCPKVCRRCYRCSNSCRRSPRHEPDKPSVTCDDGGRRLARSSVLAADTPPLGPAQSALDAVTMCRPRLLEVRLGR